MNNPDNNKDRLSSFQIPAKFSDWYGQKVMATRWWKEGVRLYSKDSYAKLEDDLKKASQKPEAKFDYKFIKFILRGSFFETQIDEEGKILLPDRFLDYVAKDKSLLEVKNCPEGLKIVSI